MESYGFNELVQWLSLLLEVELMPGDCGSESHSSLHIFEHSNKKIHGSSRQLDGVNLRKCSVIRGLLDLLFILVLMNIHALFGF